MSYNIFQIKISDEIYEHVNGPEGGHSATAKVYQAYHARMECSFDGSKRFLPEMFEHYTKVCEVAGFEDRNLETVFKILNGYYFDEETGKDETFDNFVSGFEMRTFLNKKTKEVRQVRDMHSLSVGDIVEDTVTGTFHMVDGMGFSEIEVNSLEVA
jgi:hypothetical protein